MAQMRSVRGGDVLYAPSHPDVPLFIVLEGTVSITRAGEDEKILAVREPGQFTGEMSVISGNRSLLTARVTNDGVVLELTRDKVLTLMAKDTELGEILMGAFVARRLLMIQLGEGNVILFGTKGSARTLAIREFLTRNGHPFAYVDIDSDNCASELMEQLAVRHSELPVVYCNRRYVLRNPSISELAACLDLNINVDKGVRDVLVIGAGPGGLAAAVYAASEGLKTLVIEKSAPGGQAGSSSKIENYLGFPTGLSGQELANRSIAQAQKFGAQLMVAQSVVHTSARGREISDSSENESFERPRKLFGTVQDITERKRSDEERQLLSRKLEESNARLEEAQRVAHLGHWIWDLETNRVTFSNETCRIYGLKPQEDPIDLETIRELIHPEDREYVFENAERAVRDGVPIETEHRLIRPNGQVRTVYSPGDLKRDASGRPYQMFGTCQDITDRKRAEETLKQTQFYLSEGQRLAHIGSWAFNDSIHYWSDELFAIYKLDRRAELLQLNSTWLSSIHKTALPPLKISGSCKRNTVASTI